MVFVSLRTNLMPINQFSLKTLSFPDLTYLYQKSGYQTICYQQFVISSKSKWKLGTIEASNWIIKRLSLDISKQTAKRLLPIVQIRRVSFTTTPQHRTTYSQFPLLEQLLSKYLHHSLMFDNTQLIFAQKACALNKFKIYKLKIYKSTYSNS